MAYKKIRKSASLWGVVFSLLIVLGIFTGLFLYWQKSAELADIPIDAKYNQTYDNLTLARSTLNTNVEEIQESYKGIQEATTGFFSWNGLRLLGSTMKLPISLLTTTKDTYEAFDYSLAEVIPGWLKILIIIGLTAFILFLLLSVLRGRK